MKAYSLDLRQRVVEAIDKKEGTQVQVATRFAVSVQWVRKILRQRRNTGSIEAKPHGGGRAPAFDTQATAKLREALAQNNDATLLELATATGVKANPAMVYRALVRADITRKKSRGGRPNKTAPTSSSSEPPGASSLPPSTPRG